MLAVEQLSALGVKVPPEYIRIQEIGLSELEPWSWIAGEELHSRVSMLKGRYPERDIVPFAERQDCDDIACWDLEMPGTVVVIHDYASKGYESRAHFGSFRDWIHQALDDSMDFI